MKDGILQDWDANRGNWKSRGVLVLYRLAQEFLRQPAPVRWLGYAVAVVYTLVVEWILGIELNLKSRIGPGLRIYHGVGLVLHEKTALGHHCVLRHNTTIGMKNGPDDCPILGNNVEVGCNSVLMGKIVIGDGAMIGAGSVVRDDVAAGDVVAGNPARSIRKN